MSHQSIITCNVGELWLSGTTLSGDPAPIFEGLDNLSDSISTISNDLSGVLETITDLSDGISAVSNIKLKDTDIFDMNGTDWDFRTALSVLWQKLGGRVVAILVAFALSLFSINPLFGDDTTPGMIEHRDMRPTYRVVTNAWQAVQGNVSESISEAVEGIRENISEAVAVK